MMLRMRAIDIVEDAGYTPLEALDAAEAVAILESRSDVVLMCTDIQMPGQMDGMGLAHAVHERWPTIGIIVVSGQLNLSNLDLPGATITATCWHAQVGQRVIEGDRLLEILVGDAIVDLPAPASGKLIERTVQADNMLQTGQLLALIEADDE